MLTTRDPIRERDLERIGATTAVVVGDGQTATVVLSVADLDRLVKIAGWNEGAADADTPTECSNCGEAVA